MFSALKSNNSKYRSLIVDHITRAFCCAAAAPAGRQNPCSFPDFIKPFQGVPSYSKPFQTFFRKKRLFIFFTRLFEPIPVSLQNSGQFWIAYLNLIAPILTYLNHFWPPQFFGRPWCPSARTTTRFKAIQRHSKPIKAFWKKITWGHLLAALCLGALVVQVAARGTFAFPNPRAIC